MVQHKDLMKFPLQLWLGLLCYCCGTQPTSILPVLLLGGCGGYSCHLSWSAYISRRICVGAILLALSLASTLNGLIFTTEPATIVWASAGESGLDVSICSRIGFGLCCCHLRFPGAACSQGGRARLCLTFCICAGHVSSPKRLTRLIGGAFLDGWLRRIREHLLLLGACWLRFFLLRLLCIPDSCLSSKWCSLISEKKKWPKIATLRSENKLPKNL